MDFNQHPIFPLIGAVVLFFLMGVIPFAGPLAIWAFIWFLGSLFRRLNNPGN
jgi:hypothetical protein